MFWPFKLSFVVDILALFLLGDFEKLGEFFSHLLVTLAITELVIVDVKKINLS
jgi:hypothetical protein